MNGGRIEDGLSSTARCYFTAALETLIELRSGVCGRRARIVVPTVSIAQIGIESQLSGSYMNAGKYFQRLDLLLRLKRCAVESVRTIPFLCDRTALLNLSAVGFCGPTRFL
jgi:hypothetical protein